MASLPPSASGPDGLDQADRRVTTLYEIGKLLLRIKSVEETFRAIIALIVRALPLCSALVILDQRGLPRTIAYASEGADATRAEAHALASYAYLVGAVPEHPAGAFEREPGHLIVLPIVVESRPIFGVLQLESSARLSEQDLIFVNAVVNQLAIALDWQAMLEARQAIAEAATARAEVGKATAERLQERAEALAADNAHLLEKAERASRAREDVLAVVSHDLRNQLNAILMSATLLLRKRPTNDVERRARRNILTIQRSAEGMDRLIGDLLDVASIESGSLSLERQAERVGALVQSALELLEEQAAAGAIRLSSEVIVPETEVVCDRQRIQQVFSNLIGNAIKFTPPGGAISVRVEPQAESVRFAVSDTGGGIPGEELPHVFDRFRQGSHASRGSGLGLAIAKGIIEAHGGAIWLESEVGIGTTVFFTLPGASS